MEKRNKAVSLRAPMDRTAKFLLPFLNSQTEVWSQSHEEPLHPWELHGRLKVALAIFESIQLIDEQWSEAVRQDQLAVDADEARVLENLYNRWLEPANKIGKSIAETQSDSMYVDGAAEFRDACYRARMKVELGIEKTVRAVKRLEKNGGRPLTEVTDGLHNRSLG